jgi:hypothetical protein
MKSIDCCVEAKEKKTVAHSTVDDNSAWQGLLPNKKLNASLTLRDAQRG